MLIMSDDVVFATGVAVSELRFPDDRFRGSALESENPCSGRPGGDAKVQVKESATILAYQPSS